MGDVASPVVIDNVRCRPLPVHLCSKALSATPACPELCYMLVDPNGCVCVLLAVSPREERKNWACLTIPCRARVPSKLVCAEEIFPSVLSRTASVDRSMTGSWQVLAE